MPSTKFEIDSLRKAKQGMYTPSRLPRLVAQRLLERIYRQSEFIAARLKNSHASLCAVMAQSSRVSRITRRISADLCSRWPIGLDGSVPPATYNERRVRTGQLVESSVFSPAAVRCKVLSPIAGVKVGQPCLLCAKIFVGSVSSRGGGGR